jgi:hypothetical protein
MDLFTFITAEKYDKALASLIKIENDHEIGEIDKAEALETSGIFEFYNGDWDKACNHLERSLSEEFSSIERRRKPRRIGVVHLLVMFLFFYRICSSLFCCSLVYCVVGSE